MARAQLFAHSPYSRIELDRDTVLIRGGAAVEVTDDQAFALLRGYHEHVAVEADPPVVQAAASELAAQPRAEAPTVPLPSHPGADVPLPPELEDKIDG